MPHRKQAAHWPGHPPSWVVRPRARPGRLFWPRGCAPRDMCALRRYAHPPEAPHGRNQRPRARRAGETNTRVLRNRNTNLTRMRLEGPGYRPGRPRVNNGRPQRRRPRPAGARRAPARGSLARISIDRTLEFGNGVDGLFSSCVRFLSDLRLIRCRIVPERIFCRVPWTCLLRRQRRETHSQYLLRLRAGLGRCFPGSGQQVKTRELRTLRSNAPTLKLQCWLSPGDQNGHSATTTGGSRARRSPFWPDSSILSQA